MHYAGLSAATADERLAASFIIRKPPRSYEDVAFLTYEYEYHWAMTLAYGHDYRCSTPPVSVDLPDDYDAWEADYIEQNKLADSSYDYL